MVEGRALDGVVEREVVVRKEVGRMAEEAGVRVRVLGVLGREFTDAELVLRTEEGVLLLEEEARVLELLLAIRGS